ncbi:diguanylate cyclase [Oxalobacter sp. OttesenSCG-928-P03]|nr:diguanylate cyclase [Oxalobacter sp. OttesenSCG-928-P03]
MENHQQFTILVVDDEKTNLMVLHKILYPEYNILTATSGEEALSRAIEHRPDLILLDIILPDINGFDVLLQLKQLSETRNIPVIIVSGLTSEGAEERGFFFGAVDYITKPFKNTIVKARVRTHLQTVQHIRMIEKLGMIDTLTNIPNRRSFNERIEMEWRRAIRKQLPISLLMLDVDRFKVYNDTYGHPQGDTLLRTITQIFTESLNRPGDMAARLGGEEFAILLPDSGMDAALSVAERIRRAIEKARIPATTPNGDIETTTTISIGAVSVIPKSEEDLPAFIARADEYLYAAKNSGRNRVCSEPD